MQGCQCRCINAGESMLMSMSGCLIQLLAKLKRNCRNEVAVSKHSNIGTIYSHSKNRIMLYGLISRVRLLYCRQHFTWEFLPLPYSCELNCTRYVFVFVGLLDLSNITNLSCVCHIITLQRQDHANFPAFQTHFEEEKKLN